VSEILSREEFDRCNPLPEGRPTVVWQSHLEAQAATIEALAAALEDAHDYVDCSDATNATSQSLGVVKAHRRYLALVKKGWLK